MSVETQFARTTDGTHVAYQVTGHGPLDIVFLRAWVADIESEWDEPVLARMLRRLQAMGRLIRLDRRGMGMSDRITNRPPPTLEERMDDIRAVMDAVNSRRALFFSLGHGGDVAAVFAAVHPERTVGLALYHPFARGKWATDYPWGHRDDDLPALFARLAAQWGTRAYAERWAHASGPSRAGDDRFVSWWVEQLSRSGSADDAIALVQVQHETDITDTLAAIHTPTLVLSRRPYVERSRYFADRVPGARFVEVPGDDEFATAGDTDAILAEIESFVDELRGSPAGADIDRVLATLLFSDIVGSTERAGQVGDRTWSELLTRHHSAVEQLVHGFRGRVVDTAGDGVFATFDGTGRAIRCAKAMVGEAQELGLDVRIGLHTGECELAGDALRGVAVHVGARVAALAGPSEVLVTHTVRDLVAGAGFEFLDRGAHSLKGLEGEWRLYAVG